MSSNNAQAQAREHDRAVRRAERERARRVARDEAAERKRAAKSGFANVSNPRRSRLLTLVCAVFAVYCLFPFVYLAVNATKTQADFTSTFGLGFGRTFALWDNIKTVFTYDGGIFGRWLLNTILYVVVGAGGATLLAILGGYGLAKFRFPGRKAVFVVIIGAISVPGIALAVPQFLLFAKLNLTNTPWAMIIPSLVSTFGLYLMWIFSEQAVPTGAARGRARGRRGRDAHVLPGVAAIARAGHRDHGPVLDRGDVEQLLPAVDHAQGLELVSADDRVEPVEGPGVHRWRAGDPEPGDHGLAGHDHPVGDRVPVLAEVLAVRPRRRRSQRMIEQYLP